MIKKKDILTPDEIEVLDLLCEAWSMYELRLPKNHPDEQGEFRHVIHEAQRIIMSRGVVRILRNDS